jgi:hypothetical protein
MLVSPSGTPMTAIASSGDGLDNYDLILDGALDSGLLNSGTSDVPAAPYFSRRAQPSSPLTAFAGENAAGNWQLRICDTYPTADNGTYNRAQLILEPAAEIVVTTALDVVNAADGVTSLREAMKVAEATAGTVSFDPALAGATLSLSTAAPDVGLGASAFNVQSAIVIDGKDAPGLTLMAATPMRFFVVYRTGSVTLRNITLSGGQTDAGAVAWVDRGTLSVESATLTNNTASAYGGVVFSNEGIVRFIDATLSGNHAGTSGGVVFHAGAAALYTDSATLTGNTAGSYGGGISNAFGLVELANSIVAGNVAGDISGSASGASHHNLLGDPASAGGLAHGVNGNIVGNGLGGALPIATILDTVLSNNGGPTRTHALTPGSPALDAGMTDRVLDQRGVSRPQGPAADIGAFEVEDVVVSNAADSGGGSLRAAIANSPSGRRIVFDSSLSGGTILLTSGPLTISKNLTIDASELAGGLTIQPASSFRVALIESGRKVVMQGLTFSGGASDYGAGIRNNGTLTLIDSTVSGNQASTQGGGLYNYFGNLTLIRVTMTGNSAPAGGAIWAAGATTRVENSTIQGNQGTNHAGIVNENGSLTVVHSTIVENQAIGASSIGGGLSHLEFGQAMTRIENSIVAKNTASFGPDVYKNGGGVTPIGANLIGNNALVGTEFPVSPLVGTTAGPLDPGLLPLGHYGGPSRTLHPLVGSPVIDAAPTTIDSPTTDQRGSARLVDGDGDTLLENDIGAVEVPEPGFVAQLAFGAACLLGLSRRRRTA